VIDWLSRNENERKKIRRIAIIAALVAAAVALLLQMPSDARVATGDATSASWKGITLSQFAAYPADVRRAIIKSEHMAPEELSRLWQEHLSAGDIVPHIRRDHGERRRPTR
jgi:hypothetical protein